MSEENHHLRGKSLHVTTKSVKDTSTYGFNVTGNTKEEKKTAFRV